MEVTKPQIFQDMEEIKQKVLALTPEEARKIGIKHRSTLKRVKDRTMKDGKINLNIKKVKKILKIM